MKLAKVKPQVEFMEAFNSREFPALRMYLSDFMRDGDTFISEIRDGELNFKLTLQDYCCNESESKELFERVNGTIHWDIIKVVTL